MRAGRPRSAMRSARAQFLPAGLSDRPQMRVREAPRIFEPVAQRAVKSDMGEPDRRQRKPALVAVLPEAFAVALEMWLVMHSDLRGVRRVRLLFQHLAEALSSYAGAPKDGPARPLRKRAEPRPPSREQGGKSRRSRGPKKG